MQKQVFFTLIYTMSSCLIFLPFSTLFFLYSKIRPIPNQFDTARWSKTLHKITQIKIEYCLHHNKPLSKEKEIFTHSDLQSLATLLILKPSVLNAQMLQLTISLKTFCGRGSDLGDANVSSVYAEEAQNSYVPFFHLGQYVNRSKTELLKVKHAAYPQRDSSSFMCCYVWGMSYLFVMCKHQIVESGKLFPAFSKLCRHQSNNQVESRLSPVFNKILDEIWVLMEERFGSASENGNSFPCVTTPAVFIFP